MKIRNGFVSNSSSSSFIIYGNKVDNEEELEMLLRKNKKDLNKEAKKYYEDYKKNETNVFDYLLNKFCNKDNTIITEDDQYYDLKERNVYEVDINTFMNKLNQKDSWIYKTIEGNVLSSLYDVNIKYRDTSKGDSPIENIYSNNAVSITGIDKGLKRELVDYCMTCAIDDLKHDLSRTQSLLGDGFKIYFISFSTDDGNPEPFDSFFRSGIPFNNADIVRDERS